MSVEIKERRKRVASNLKRLRKSRGIKTSEELASIMEMNPSYMRRLESGHAPFGADMELRFAQFYDVDFSEFYKFDPQSEMDIELAQLQEKLKKLGGAEKIRQLSQMADVLLSDGRKEEDHTVPAQKYGNKKRA